MPNLDTLVRRWGQLKAERDPWESDWSLLGEFLCPRKRWINTEHQAGEKQTTTRVFDCTGIQEPVALAASLGGMLTSPAQQWFSLVPRDPKLAEALDVREWLEDASYRVWSAIHAGNFVSEAGEVYLDLGVFGTGCVLTEPAGVAAPGRFPGYRFTAIPTGEYVIGEGADGRVDTLFRQVRMSARAAAQQFGVPALGDALGAIYEQRPDELITVLHAVLPNDEYDARRAGDRGMRWASIYFTEQERHRLKRGGYHEFPFAVPRWAKTAGETYGRGPGHTALPDIRTLNRVVELWLQSGAKAVDPPLLQLEDAVRGDPTLEPAGINVIREPGALAALESKGRFEVAVQLFERLEAKIRRVFFADQLQLFRMDSPAKTATEVLAIQELALRILGPTAGHLTSEFHGPLIERCVALMYRAGALPPVPEALLRGGEIDVQYEGVLARAARGSDLDAIQKVNTWAAGVAQATGNLEVWDNLDLDEQAVTIARLTGYPADALRDREDVEALRAARREAQAQAAQAAGIAQMAEAAGKAAPMLTAVDQAAQGRAA